MKNDDYKTEFEEHRREIRINDGENTPSRAELHRKGRKPKEKTGNATINIILALFTLIPIGILLNVIFDFYTPSNGTSANADNTNTSYEMNKDISEDKTGDINKEIIIEDEADDSSKKPVINTNNETEEKEEAKTEVKPEEKVETKTEVKPETKTEVKPETKQIAKPETKPDENPVGKTHKVAPGETLYRISMNYYKSDSGVDKIRQANGLSSNNIMVGQKLIIP